VPNDVTLILVSIAGKVTQAQTIGLSCADHQNASWNQKASKEYAEARHLPEAIVHLMLYHQELVIVASACIIRRRRPEEMTLEGAPTASIRAYPARSIVALSVAVVIASDSWQLKRIR
jgi:hypothetical protein